MTNQTKSPSTLLNELIGDISPLSRQKKVHRAIEVHFQDSAQRDGRGRRTSELEHSCKALRHLRNMPSWQTNERYDLNMRRRIKDILKHVDHGQPWPKTIEECSQARGIVNKAARRLNERKEYGFGAPKRLGLRFVCYPLNSASKLRAAGIRGKNCLGRRGEDHFAEIKSGEAEFYEIKSTGGRSIAFLRIDSSSRTVTDIQGPDNDEADLPIKTLWAICQELEVNGDECADFVRSGVLSLVKESQKTERSPVSQIHDFRIWWRSGEIVVKDLAASEWSRFTWDITDWSTYSCGWIDSDGSAIDLQAFALMLRCQPELSEIAEQARPPDGRPTRSGFEQMRRHGRRIRLRNWL